MSEKLSKRMHKSIPPLRWGKYEQFRRWADEVAALEQQLAAKDAEIARLRELLSNRLPHQLENMAALAETPAAPTTLCGQAERDKRLIELTTDNSFIYYGPHPCPACGYTICKVANEQGGEAFDYPVGPIYPNTNWTIHNCQRSAFKGPHDSEGSGCEIHELGGDSCRGCDPAAPEVK